MKAAVIGAGPMGLAAAMNLARAGADVTVFEADDVLGGMSATFDFDGVPIERYYHFINMPDQDLFALLRDLDMEKDLRWTPTRMGMFRPPAAGGLPRIMPWDGPMALLRFPDAPLLTRLRYGLHILSCKYIRDLNALDDYSAKDWITRWEGAKGYDTLWRFLFEKKFFEYAHPLSAAWIASRVQRVANSRSGFEREQLGYLEGGSLSLLEKMAAVITDNGGTIRLSCRVDRAGSNPDGTVSVRSGGNGETFDTLISTIPLPYIAEIMPDLPEAYLAAARAVRNVGCACALFRLKKTLTPFFWLNTNVPDWDVPGIIEYSNLRPMDAAYVYVPFYMPHSHPNWAATDETLLNAARVYLRAVNPDAADGEEAARMFRYQWAQPVCPPGSSRHIPAYEPGARGMFIADTTHSFPQDRSINESVRIGKELAEHALAAR